MTKEECEVETSKAIMEMRNHIEDLEAKNATLELKIKKITQHLEPQTMTALFEQVEEEAKQEELLNSTLEENKDIYKKMADLDTALEDCTESLTDARIKIKELEKENAELKERNIKFQKILTEDFIKDVSVSMEYADKLEQAKELIRQLCLMVRELNNPNVQLTNEAEQFLKECE